MAPLTPMNKLIAVATKYPSPPGKSKGWTALAARK
jgi:hypothetical protein